MWQIGIIMYGLMFPEYGFPFETNKEYKEWCLGDLEQLSSDRITNMNNYNSIYTD